MIAFAWLRRRCRPSSPPDASSSAGRRPDARRPASSSDSLDLSTARAGAGVRHGARRLGRGLRPVLAAALLALPLLAGLTAGAEAQTVSISAPADAKEGSAGGRDIQFSLSHSGTTPTNDAIVRNVRCGDFSPLPVRFWRSDIVRPVFPTAPQRASGA